MPADLQAAIFIVLHIPPNCHSFLPQILTACRALIACAALEGEPVRPGRIYVTPPDPHLAIREGRVRLLHTPKVNRFRPVIDVLFRSVVHAYADRVVGIVLSGVLQDGTCGLKASKQYGGLAVVQDPQEAEFPLMCLNAKQHVAIYYCLYLSKICSLIIHIVRDSGQLGSLDPSRLGSQSGR